MIRRSGQLRNGREIIEHTGYDDNMFWGVINVNSIHINGLFYPKVLTILSVNTLLARVGPVGTKSTNPGSINARLYH